MTWPDTLISDIARRRCVIVLGSGISRQSMNAANSRPKMWFQFLDDARANLQCAQAARERIKKLMNDGDLLTACEAIKNRMGEAAFRDLVCNEYLNPAFAPAPIHDHIINLDSRITATPNFDKIYESRINHLQHGSVAVKAYYDNDLADMIRSSRRIVIKVHGSVDKPSEMIFTRTEYAKARYQYSSFYNLLQALIITNTFLFLGCGLNDPDVRLLLEDYAFRHGYGRPHFFVLPKGQVHADFKVTFESSLNINVIEYDPQNYHELLAPGIAELVKLVTARRMELAGTQQW